MHALIDELTARRETGRGDRRRRRQLRGSGHTSCSGAAAGWLTCSRYDKVLMRRAGDRWGHVYWLGTTQYFGIQKILFKYKVTAPSPPPPPPPPEFSLRVCNDDRHACRDLL